MPYYNSSGKLIGVIGIGVELAMEDMQKITSITPDAFMQHSNRSFIYNVCSSYHKQKLTTREAECLFFLLRGLSAKEVSSKLHISSKTVEYYNQNLRVKFNCHNKSQLIAKALAQGYFYNIPESLITKYVEQEQII